MNYLYGTIIGLHLLGAVLWVGGMFFAVAVLRPSLAGQSPAERMAVWRLVLPRFFRWVAAAIVLLVVTGLGALHLYHGGLFGAGLHVDVMMLFALVMVAFYLFAVALPWRAFRKALDGGDLAAAAHHLDHVKAVVSVNLGLGLVTAFIGAAGTFIGH